MKSSGHWKAALPALLLLGLGLGGLAAPHLLPDDDARVAVVAPRHEALRIVAAAGGLAFGGSAGTVYAVSTEPGFVQRLYESGAWLVLRYDGAAGCLQANLEESSNERS